METKIDFVIPWVDGADPNWLKEKEKHIKTNKGDSREIRYRDLDNLVFWFRGVEKYAPWVNKIHFITWEHLPKWLNTHHKKLNIVKHEEYIPDKYLPTFSSRPIELNLHRINNLSETFVYFNDDTFIIKPVCEEDFFNKGLPADTAVMSPLVSLFRNSTAPIIANIMEIINTKYHKRDVLSKNYWKWFHPKYGKFLISNFLMLPYKHFSSFLNLHLPNSYLKSTFVKVWNDEYSILNRTCQNKFRTRNDVNQILLKFTQLMEGKFHPRSPKIGKTYNFTNNNTDIVSAIANQKHKLICINDNGKEKVKDFESQKEIINNAFKKILNEKSNFER